MESPIIKTEPVSEDESRKWINTKGHCFMCLKRSAEIKVISLQSLLQHLHISGLSPTSSSSWSQEWNKNIEVDLCKSCGPVGEKLSSLLKQLEKIQMEVRCVLEQTHQSISESSKDPELLDRFSKKMDTSSDFELVDQLRKELLKKFSVEYVIPAKEATPSSDSDKAGPSEIQSKLRNGKQIMSGAGISTDGTENEPLPSPSTSGSANATVPKKRLNARVTRTESLTQRLIHKKPPKASNAVKLKTSENRKRSTGIESVSSSRKATTISTVNRDCFLRKKYKYFSKKGNAYSYKYTCDKCSKTFSKTNDLAQHVQRIHQGMITIHNCDKCQKPFTSSLGLKYHFTKSGSKCAKT